MARLLRRRQFRELLRSRFLTVGLMVVASAVSLALGREIARRVAVQQEIDRLTKDIVQAERATKDLKQLIATVQSSTFQEGTARTRFNLQRPGENVLVIPNLNTGVKPSPPGSAGPETVDGNDQARPDERTNVRRWWQFLFSSSSSS